MRADVLRYGIISIDIRGGRRGDFAVEKIAWLSKMNWADRGTREPGNRKFCLEFGPGVYVYKCVHITDIIVI